MAFLIFLIFGLVVMPFFAFGMKQLWLVALLFWVPLAVYAAYVWTLPFDPTEDEQMASAWRMIVSGVVLGGIVAFAGGLATARFRARRRTPNTIDLEETFE
jgi:hypothetical protein